MTTTVRSPASPVVVVTGAARGIGAAVVSAFADSGHPTCFGYLQSEAEANSLAAQLRSEGRCVVAHRLDVRDAESVEEFASHAEHTLGPPSILVNNAGVRRDALLIESEPAEWAETTSVNIIGAYLMCRRLLPHMVSQRWGRIVNVSSVAGQLGSPGQTAYCASKAGLDGLTRSLAAEVSRRNVLVNAVAPGFVPTAMTAAVTEPVQRAIASQIPQRRFASPEEIAAVVHFLASDGASYLTGQVVAIDGGATSGATFPMADMNGGRA